MPVPVPVGGLFETHLTVSDIGRSVAFYRDVVGLAVALEDTERGAAVLWIGEPGEAMVGPSDPPPSGCRCTSPSRPRSTLSSALATA